MPLKATYTHAYKQTTNTCLSACPKDECVRKNTSNTRWDQDINSYLCFVHCRVFRTMSGTAVEVEEGASGRESLPQVIVFASHPPCIGDGLLAAERLTGMFPQ